MPTFPTYSPWQQDAAAIGGLGQQMNQIVAGLAQQKYQQAAQQQQTALRLMQLQQQAALNRQHGQLYDAQTAAARADELLTNAKAKDTERGVNLGQEFGKTFDYIGQAQANPNMPFDMSRLQATGLGQAAELAARGQHYVPVNMAQLNQMGNQRMQALMATGTPIAQSMPSQSIAMDVISGLPSFVSPQKLNAGETMVPGTGGPAMASAPFAPYNERNNLASIFGSSQNFNKQFYDSSGELVEGAAEDPRYKANQQLIGQLIQTIQANLSNQPVQRSNTVQGQQAQIDTGSRLVSPKDKVALATQISQQNPTWTKEQVLQAVKEQLGE